MYMIVLIAPIGLIAGLIYDDIKQHYQWKAVLIRNIFACSIIIAFIIIIGFVSSKVGFKNKGYLSIPLLLPVVIAVLSNLISRSNKVSQAEN